MEDEVLDIVEDDKIVEEEKEKENEKKVEDDKEENEKNKVITDESDDNTDNGEKLPVNQNSAAIDSTIGEIVSNTNNYIKNEDKKLSSGKKVAIVILSLLLLVDLGVLVIYIIGFDKVFTFIK